jgi:hypothetical protein
MSLESAFRTFVEEAKISRHAREEILEELEDSELMEEPTSEYGDTLDDAIEIFQDLEDRVERLEAEHNLRGGENGEE